MLLQRLKYKRDCFDDGRVPISLDPPQVSTKEIIPIHYNSNGLDYQPWEVMISNLLNNGYFQKDPYNQIFKKKSSTNNDH